MGATKIKDRWVGRYRGKTDDTAKRIISSLDGRWKETESGLTGTDRGLLEGEREEEEEAKVKIRGERKTGVHHIGRMESIA